MDCGSCLLQGEGAKKKYKKVPLETKSDVAGLNKSQKDLFIEEESKMQQQDRIIKVRNHHVPLS